MRRKQFWLTWVNCQNILMRKIRWLIFALSVKVGMAYLGQFDLGPSLKQWWLWRFKLGLGPYHMIIYRSVPEWAVLCNNVKIKLPWAKWADLAALHLQRHKHNLLLRNASWFKFSYFKFSYHHKNMRLLELPFEQLRWIPLLPF